MTTPTAPHFLCFRLVDAQSSPIKNGRQYALTWTDTGATSETSYSGTTDANGRTSEIQTVGAVAVRLAIAPPAGGECQPVGHSVTSKAKDKNRIVTVRLAFAAITATAPKSQNHCETLTLRSGKQRVKYLINNVPRVLNGGEYYSSYLGSFPYLIVDADTLEVLHSGTTQDQPAKFTGSKTQVSTVEVAVDGVTSVGIILGGAANGDPQRWKDEAGDLVMYRVKPAPEGLTTVTITEKAEVGEEPQTDRALTEVEIKPINTGSSILNGLTWRTFTRSYSMEDIRKDITGVLTLDTPSGITTWYEIENPTATQIDWALTRAKISAAQAARYHDILENPSTTPFEARHNDWLQVPESIRGPEPLPPPPPLRLQLAWAELLEPIYTGAFDGGYDEEQTSPGGSIVIHPLGLEIELKSGFSDNAEEIAGINQKQVLTHNHPYIYMMLLSACAQVGATHVKIVGSWRPMLGSILHKLGDALDVTEVDNKHDQLAMFTFSGSHVRNNDLAKRFNTALYDHRYARATQHIYYGDDYLHGSDNYHKNHLHITCNSRDPLHERDTSGYRGPADPEFESNPALVAPTRAPAPGPELPNYMNPLPSRPWQ